MNKDDLKFIAVNRDAAAVNRGFYFQYLKVLYKWVDNFINDRDSDVFTEVGDDIKEVNGKVIFTQVKCYSSTFNLKSKEVQKSIFNFFALYLEEFEKSPELEFHFVTNTAIAKNEHLLKNWIAAIPDLKGDLLNQCKKKIKEIINDELKRIRALQLSAKKITEEKKAAIKKGFKELQEQLDNPEFLEKFIKNICWDFGGESPDEAIASLNSDILQMLKHPKFDGKPFHLLMETLLSEIYRCSQLSNSSQRLVNNGLLKTILAKKIEELDGYINKSLIHLMDVRFNAIYKAISDIQTLQLQQATVQAEQGETLADIHRTLSDRRSDHKLPRQLTQVPHINKTDVIGRDREVSALRDLLGISNQVLIQGDGGMGKSTLAKLYMNSFQEEYDHIIWLNTEAGLLNSVQVNTGLAQTLKLELMSPEDEEKKIAHFIFALNAMPGNNILIINGLPDAPEYLDQLKTLRNWQTLITARIRIAGWVSLPFGNLLFDDACSLYRKFEPVKEVADSVFRDFFEMIGYNTLTIELVAKTIHYSFDLTLTQVLSYLRNQKLDDEDLEIDVPGPGQTTVRLLKYLQTTFDLNNLDSGDRYYMELFALLPADETKLSDIIDWYGQEYVKSNKVQMTNAINRLHQKGLLERDGDQLRMHKVFQESILYEIRKQANAFAGQVFHLAWLTSRIHEGAQNNPAQALRFLKYGESILHNIKEPFRRSVYQPLLALENEVLNIYNWLITQDNMVSRWQSLTERAEKYLYDDDSLLGIITNNYGLSLAGQQQREAAAIHFKKAIAILKLNEENVVTQLITTICNLAQLCVEERDLTNFKLLFDEMVSIREKYKIWEDVSFPLQCNILANANQSIKNYPVAIQMYTIAINTHLELPKDKRNDMNLVLYLNGAAISYLCNNELNKAEQVVNRAVGILEQLQTADSKALANVIETMLMITEMTGDKAGSKILKTTLKNIFKM